MQRDWALNGCEIHAGLNGNPWGCLWGFPGDPAPREGSECKQGRNSQFFTATKQEIPSPYCMAQLLPWAQHPMSHKPLTEQEAIPTARYESWGLKALSYRGSINISILTHHAEAGKAKATLLLLAGYCNTAHRKADTLKAPGRAWEQRAEPDGLNRIRQQVCPGEAVLVWDAAVLQLHVIYTAQKQEEELCCTSTPHILLTAMLTLLGRLLSPHTHLRKLVLQQSLSPPFFSMEQQSRMSSICLTMAISVVPRGILPPHTWSQGRNPAAAIIAAPAFICSVHLEGIQGNILTAELQQGQLSHLQQVFKWMPVGKRATSECCHPIIKIQTLSH